jgi:hypothetical protein
MEYRNYIFNASMTSEDYCHSEHAQNQEKKFLSKKKKKTTTTTTTKQLINAVCKISVPLLNSATETHNNVHISC